ncbi:MAG: heme ABC transporter permease CcmC [Hellea sp.]|nr:heme ABC transporter permease CcmC [Hellea sp.]
MISYLANPSRYLKFSKNFSPFAGWITLMSLLLALYYALLKSPPAEEHGQAVRMMYTHVPAAWCALLAYTCLTVASIFSFIWRHPLADSAAKSIATPGLAFTFLALLTGSLWGKPAWGTWWQWDGRMTSVLILFFIYIGYLTVWSVIPERKKAARLASIIAMVGFINIPIIKFSVDWWNTLHQPASISSVGSPGLPLEILTPLLLMTLSYSLFFMWLVIKGIEKDITKMNMQNRKNRPLAFTEVEDI